MHKFFNPNRFVKIADSVLPFAVLSAIFLSAAGLYQALLASPADYQQGDAVRMMYVHVPAAWMALMVYTMIAAFSAAGLIWKNPLSDMTAIAIAPLGAGFTLICLITGSLWGKPIWGAWWVWDARLTSVLILFFLYLGYIALYHAFDDISRGPKAAAILALVGSVNLPVIKFSVEWWHTLHQPASLLRQGGVTIDSSMLLPLLLMFGAYFSIFITLAVLRIKTEINIRKAARAQNMI